jgi:hypothetical protein
MRNFIGEISMLNPFWVVGGREVLLPETVSGIRGRAQGQRRPNTAHPGFSLNIQPFSNQVLFDAGEVSLITGRGASHGRKRQHHSLNHTEDMKMEYLHDC